MDMLLRTYHYWYLVTLTNELQNGLSRSDKLPASPEMNSIFWKTSFFWNEYLQNTIIIFQNDDYL